MSKESSLYASALDQLLDLMVLLGFDREHPADKILASSLLRILIYCRGLMQEPHTD